MSLIIDILVLGFIYVLIGNIIRKVNKIDNSNDVTKLWPFFLLITGAEFVYTKIIDPLADKIIDSIKKGVCK